MYLYLLEKYDIDGTIKTKPLMFALHLIHINIVPTICKKIPLTATKATSHSTIW